MTPRPTGILLAAGRSTRFGANKLLQPLADGTPMVVACARALRTALPHCVAVVDEADGEVASALVGTGVEIVVNRRARDGMGSSIARGVSASAAAAGWIIALADMPRVPVDVIRRIADSLAGGADLVAPVWHGRRGHPVGFSARHAAALRALEGDTGARDLLKAGVTLIDTEDRGVVIDIDTPADFFDLGVK